MDKKRVIIAGGGIGGAQLVAKLQGKADIVLVDPKEYFEVPMAAPREMVNPDFSNRAVIPYGDFLKAGRHVQGKMVNVFPDHISVEKNDSTLQELPYDFLIIATGSKYRSDLVKADSGSVEERYSHYDTLKKQIDDANRILIIGGGPVGVEISSEILEVNPEKKLTLVHSGSRLLDASSSKTATRAAAHLKGKRATIVLDEKVVDNHESDVVTGPKTATTDKDRKIEFDLLLWCIGARHDTSYMNENYGDVLDENGRIKAEKNFLVEGQSNIFALGDVTALKETKLAAWTTMHVPVVLKNILTLIENPGTDHNKLKRYKAKTGNEMMLVALGPKNGAGTMPWGDFLGDLTAKKLKAKDMLVGMYRKKVGVPK